MSNVDIDLVDIEDAFDLLEYCGAGGFDAVSLLVRDDEETVGRLERFLGEWSAKKKDSKVKLLGVKGELEGIRVEKLREFDGWLS